MSTSTELSRSDGAPEVARDNEANPSAVRATRRAALFVMVQPWLILVPLLVLGAAIEWPASLDDPAEVALPRLLDNEAAVRVGYLVYLLYSLLFLPVAVIVYRWVHTNHERAQPIGVTIGMQVALGMAAASVLARSIGIVRWLSTMLPMAERWDVASAAERTAISEQFQSINDYGGTIGEVLGVSVFAAIWLGVTTIGAATTRPKWITRTGAAAAVLLLAPAIELLGLDAGPLVSVSTTGLTLWLVAVGVVMYRSAGDAMSTMPASSTS